MRSWASLLFVALAIAGPASAVEYEILALSSRPVPGLGGGELYRDFGLPVINADGGVAFRASIATASGGTTQADGEAVIGPDSSGEPALLYRTGDIAPGTAERFETFRRVNVTDAGGVAFIGTLKDVPDRRSGLWGPGESGGLVLKAREGDVLPGSDGAITSFFRGFFSLGLSVNAAGQVAFRSGDASRPFGPGIAGDLAQIERPMDPVSGAPGLQVLAATTPTLNGAGRLAFIAQLPLAGGVTAETDQGIFATDSWGVLQTVVREGDPAPGTAGAVFGQFFAVPYINEPGDIVFEATLAEGAGGVSEEDDEGIWLADAQSGELRLLARESDPVPGGPPGALYSRIAPFTVVGLNDLGEISFDGFMQIGPGGVTIDDHQVLMAPDENGELRLAIRKGDPAPLPGQSFRNPGFTAINNRGDLLFKPALMPDFPRNVFLRTRAGELHEILVEGDAFEVEAGDTRTVADVDFFGSPGTSFGERPFNDRRQIALRVDFTDRSQAIVRATVPACGPGFELALLLPALHLARRRAAGRYEKLP